MSKIINIDYSAERLISMASSMVDCRNYTGALKMLNKCSELGEADAEAFSLLAEIFDDMGLYEKSINGWFKFIDFAFPGDMADCYEGLGANYLNIGDESHSAYYYNKLLFETPSYEGPIPEQILTSYYERSENMLKFAYPPSIADCTQIFSNGIGYMKEGKFDLAIEEFGKVDPENRKYNSARNYIAMCNIIADRTEEAERECFEILKNNPRDVQALTTLAAVKTEQGKQDEARELAEKLLSLDIKDPDEIYKVATVCCENKMHEDAYKLFLRLPQEFDYDLNVLYFKAIAAFNCDRVCESIEIFDRLLTVYPDAVTARYYFNLIKELGCDDEYPELGYFYRLPSEVIESSLKIMSAYVRLSGSSAQKLSSELDISECVKWCFDEAEGNRKELHSLAVHTAVKAGLESYLRELLLNAFLDDALKTEILILLAERNDCDCYGVVISHMYKRVTTQTLKLGRTGKKYFLRAYAQLVAHFSVMDDNYGCAFAEAAEKLYKKLAKADRLGEAKNTDVLTAAVYISSGVVAAGVAGDDLYKFFGVTEKQVKKLTGEV